MRVFADIFHLHYFRRFDFHCCIDTLPMLFH
jgi:hypothetical protein